MYGEALHVLLVEDSELDVDLALREFRKAKIGNAVTVVHDGIEALAALRGEDGYPPIPRPYIILLDVHLPRMNGFEFLAELRQDPDLRDSVVFLLIGSLPDVELLLHRELDVAGYWLKEKIAQEFLQLPDQLPQWWRRLEASVRV
jgi:CheY-like chemotaxis protein